VRFDSGWTSVAALRGLATALDLAPEWRFDRIAETAALCRDALAGRVDVVTPSGQAGLVTFAPAGDPEETASRLYDEGILVRNLPHTPWVRASCGWWTSEDDITRLADALVR
jgi:selenocysteine lyase/cysteine desulfurase